MSSQRTSMSGWMASNRFSNSVNKSLPCGEYTTRGVRLSREQPRSRTTHHAPRTALRNIAALQSQQVHKQAVGSRNATGELPEKAQPRVHVRATSERRNEQASPELGRRVGRRIVRLEQRDIRRVPGVREVEPPFLNPATPILGPDLVGVVEDGIRRVECRDRRVLIGHAI